MKKKVLLIILIMIIGGFISGCEELGIGITSVKDLKDHPNNYLNKTITVKGYYRSFLTNPDRYMVQDKDGEVIYVYPDDTDTSILIKDGEYLWTGVFEQYKSSVRNVLTEVKTS